jgi:hypothetical protein
VRRGGSNVIRDWRGGGGVTGDWRGGGEHDWQASAW